MQLNPSQLLILLKSMIPARLPLLVTGAPGVGKSNVVEQATEDCKAHMLLSHPVTSDPTDAKGLPARISDTEAAFLPFGELAIAMKATEPTVWFLDDLGQAPPSVQAAFMQLILARQVNGHRLPDCVTFVAATNRRADKAGVSGILEPVKSRFAAIVELQTDLDSWCTWALTHNISNTMIAFMRFRPDLLSDFRPSADMTNSPTPRTWANASRVEALGLPTDIEHISIAGSVGEGPAAEYLGFRKMAATLVSVDAILTGPDKAALPKRPAEGYAIATALASRTNDKNLHRVGIYLERLAKGDMGEMAALCIRDMFHRTPAIANSSEYVKMMCGPIGQLMSGQSIS